MVIYVSLSNSTQWVVFASNKVNDKDMLVRELAGFYQLFAREMFVRSLVRTKHQ